MLLVRVQNILCGKQFDKICKNGHFFCIVYKYLSEAGSCPTIIEEREGKREEERVSL